jgi:hypothetical protein
MTKRKMKSACWCTAILSFAACSFTLQADEVSLYGPWAGAAGNAAAGQGAYTNGDDTVTVLPPYSPAQILVGGADGDPQFTSAAITPEGLLAPLGITTAQLNALDAGVTIGNGSAIYYHVEAGAGDTLSINADFVANDYFPYDDFAFFSAFNSTLGTADVEMLGSIDAGYPLGGGDMGSTGYYDFTYTFAAGGDYTLGFGVVNAGPAGDPGNAQFDSALLLDPAPEPSTWLLAGSAILGVLLFRRCRTAMSRQGL